MGNKMSSFEKSASFTGHRNILHENVDYLVKETCIELIKNGVNRFLCGCSLGFDCISGEEIIKIRQYMPNISLIAVLPCDFEIFTQKWNDRQRGRVKTMLNGADEIITLQRAFSNDCYRRRNQYLVDNSHYCICYYNANNFRSGTGMTVRMAERKGMEIINLFEKKI